AGMQEGRIKISNRYNFLNLERFEMAWSLLRNGVPVQEGRLPALDLPPGADSVIAIPFTQPRPQPGAEYWLNVEVRLARNEPWAGRGHVVARGQLALPVAALPLPAPDTAALPPLALTQAGAEIVVSGPGFRVSFDKATGRIATLEYGQKKYIDGVEHGLVPNLYRAMLDNDRTGNWGQPYDTRALGYDKPAYHLDSLGVVRLPGQVKVLTT